MSDKNMNSWVRYMAWGTTIATALAGLVGGGYVLGNFLDSLWGTDPWLKVFLMLGGVILGIAYLIVSLHKIGDSDHEE